MVFSSDKGRCQKLLPFSTFLDGLFLKEEVSISQTVSYNSQPHNEDDKEDDNDVEDNDDNIISALGLDRHIGYSRGHQGHWPHDDNDDKLEDYDKDDNNNMDNNDD